MINTIPYQRALHFAPFGVIAPYLTSVCTECEETVDPSKPGKHVMLGSAVVVGCEGYLMVDPNVVGIEADWEDWRSGPDAQQTLVGKKPESLYDQGDALVKFAFSLDLIPDTSKQMGHVFYDPKLVGSAIAAMTAWMDANWGPIGVRAAAKEAMYYTEDENWIGQVPRLSYGGKRLAVGDEVSGIARRRDGATREFKGVVKAIGPTYWGSELCPTNVVIEGPDVPRGDDDFSWDWEDLTRVTKS